MPSFHGASFIIKILWYLIFYDLINLTFLCFKEIFNNLTLTGADERINLEGNIEYLLVLSFASGGTLVDFLRSHTVDWLMFCKMSLSIVKGLAYLHTDHHKNGKVLI